MNDRDPGTKKRLCDALVGARATRRAAEHIAVAAENLDSARLYNAVSERAHLGAELEARGLLKGADLVEWIELDDRFSAGEVPGREYLKRTARLLPKE